MCSSWKIQICLDVSTFWEILSICVAWSMCMSAHVLAYIYIYIFLLQKICDHPHLRLSHLLVNLFRLPDAQEKTKFKPFSFFFLINSTCIFLWLSIRNPLPSKSRCSGLLWTCKTAESKPKSGCDLLYILELMDIPLAKPIYWHSSPIRLHDCMQPSCKYTVSYQKYGKPRKSISDATVNGLCSSN